MTIWEIMELARGNSSFDTGLSINHSEQDRKTLILIPSADPQSRLVVIIVWCCPYFSKSSKTKQISSENNVHYWRNCGSGRVDHWWHLSCFPYFKCKIVKLFLKLTHKFLSRWEWIRKSEHDYSIPTNRNFFLLDPPKERWQSIIVFPSAFFVLFLRVSQRGWC